MHTPARPIAVMLLVLVAAGLTAGSAAVVADSGGDGDVTLYRAPGVDDPADVEVAVANGSATPAETLVTGDRLAVVLDSERFARDLENRTGPTTKRFFAALEDDADLRIVQTNPPPDRTPKVAVIDPDNTAVHRNGTTVYALISTGSLPVERPGSGENETAALRDGDRYAVTFGYGLDEFATGGPEVDLYTTRSEFVSVETNWFDPLPPERVNRSVRVNVEPDDSLVARVALENGRNVTAPVRPVESSDYRRVSLDLREVDPGTDYVLELRHDGSVVDRYTGTVIEPSGTLSNVSVTEVNNWTAVNATANLSHGGEVRVTNEDGERLGWTAVPPGNRTAVSVRLRGSADELVVRGAREKGADEEFYPGTTTRIDFSDRQLRDPLDPATDTPTPVPTETPASSGTGAGANSESPTGMGVQTETITGSAIETETPTGAETGGSGGTGTETATRIEGAGSSDDQPGFGMGVGVASLLAVALLARRRS